MVRVAARAQPDLSWFKNWRIRKPLESCFKKPTYFLRRHTGRPAAETPCSFPFKIPPTQDSAQRKRSPSLSTQAATLRPNRWLIPWFITIRSREGSKLSGVWQEVGARGRERRPPRIWKTHQHVCIIGEGSIVP